MARPIAAFALARHCWLGFRRARVPESPCSALDPVPAAACSSRTPSCTGNGKSLRGSSLISRWRLGGAYRAAHDLRTAHCSVCGASATLLGLSAIPRGRWATCHSAASFTMALLRSEAIDFPAKPPFGQSPSATTAAKNPVKRISAAPSSLPEVQGPESDSRDATVPAVSLPVLRADWPYGLPDTAELDAFLSEARYRDAPG